MRDPANVDEGAVAWTGPRGAEFRRFEALGRLVGSVAHDFNNLLTIINVYSQMLLDDLEAASPVREVIAAIREAGERGAALTRQLLTFGRAQDARSEVIDLNRFLERASKLLFRLLGEDVACELRLSPAPCLIRAEVSLLDQVFMNLAANARDAMPCGGSFVIETALAPCGRFVQVSIRDSGSGMDEETRRRSFDPFFTTKATGNGLGLATVHAIVEALGGRIRVDSAPGEGSLFEILLPLAPGDPPAGSREEVPTDTSPRGTETLLIVEDDVAVRAVLARVLEHCGYRVSTAGDGREALLVIEGLERPPDLLVTDVVMPQVGGLSLACALLRKNPGLKVLFLSGFAGDQLSGRGVRRGEHAFLQKPFSPDALARRVREVLGDPAAPRR